MFDGGVEWLMLSAPLRSALAMPRVAWQGLMHLGLAVACLAGVTAGVAGVTAGVCLAGAEADSSRQATPASHAAQTCAVALGLTGALAGTDDRCSGRDSWTQHWHDSLDAGWKLKFRCRLPCASSASAMQSQPTASHGRRRQHTDYSYVDTEYPQDRSPSPPKSPRRSGDASPSSLWLIAKARVDASHGKGCKWAATGCLTCDAWMKMTCCRMQETA